MESWDPEDSITCLRSHIGSLNPEIQARRPSFRLENPLILDLPELLAGSAFGPTRDLQTSLESWDPEDSKTGLRFQIGPLNPEIQA